VPVFNAKTQALTDQRRVVMDQNFYKMSTVCVCGVMVAHGMIEREREREREKASRYTQPLDRVTCPHLERVFVGRWISDRSFASIPLRSDQPKWHPTTTTHRRRMLKRHYIIVDQSRVPQNKQQQVLAWGRDLYYRFFLLFRAGGLGERNWDSPSGLPPPRSSPPTLHSRRGASTPRRFTAWGGP
jgi:hypothetical protein